MLAGGKVRVSDGNSCAGQTATVVAARAALGLRSGYLGAFGSDEHGRLIRNALKSGGVDVRGSIECDAPNRGAVILVDPQGTRTVLWHRSDRLKVPFKELRVSALQGHIVHVDDDDPELALHATTIARSTGTPVTSDIEHASDQVEQLIASVTFPIFEQNLPAKLTGEQDAERALRKLRRLNDGLLVMTQEIRAPLRSGRYVSRRPHSCEGRRWHWSGRNISRRVFAMRCIRSGRFEMLRFECAAAASCALGAMPSVPTLTEKQLLDSTPSREAQRTTLNAKTRRARRLKELLYFCGCAAWRLYVERHVTEY